MRGFQCSTATQYENSARAIRANARVVNGRRSRGAGGPEALTTRRSAAASIAPAGRPQAAGLAASAAPGPRREPPGTELRGHRRGDPKQRLQFHSRQLSQGIAS